MRTSLAILFVAVWSHPALSDDHSPVPEDIPASVYEKRREQVMKSLGGCAAVLEAQSRRGIDPYFYYLTGIEEQGAMLLLSPKGKVIKTSLHLPPRNPDDEIWTGYKEPISPALRRKHRVDEVRTTRGGMPRGLSGALRRSRCYANLRSGLSDESDLDAKALGKYLKAFGARTVLRWEELERMRSIHDGEEIARMKNAIAITHKGHDAAILGLKSGRTERQVSAEIENAFYEHGGSGLAFPSIVGSGPNGAVLHWEDKDRTIGKDDLVVVDIGAEYGHYASDITRTFPVSGKFSAEQKRVYELVLAAQQQVIDAVKPGVSLDELHRIGEQAILDSGYDLPHYIGHFVGLDVHDVGDTGAALEAGMVITVEPGIYIKGKLGVRIEDEVLVTARGHELLSKELPRSVAEVEAWMAKIRSESQAE